MTRTQRFVSGFATGYAHLVAATLAGLWLTPFLLRHLGGDTYGLWLVGTQLVAYLLLMDLGVVAMLPRETAYVTGTAGRRDAADLRRLFERALTIAVLQTPLVAAAAAAALYLLPPAWAPLRGALAVVLGAFVLTFPLRIFQGALTGLQDLAFVARVQFGAWAAGMAITVWLVSAGFGLAALAAGWCATQVLAAAACAIRLAWLVPGAMPRGLAGDGLRAYVGRSMWISVSQVSQVLLNGTDVLVIGALLGPAAVVTYACTGKLVSVLANQPQAVLQSAAPALSELRTAGDRRRLFAVTAGLAQAALTVSGVVGCVVLSVNGAFVSWWVGPDRFGGTALTLLLLAAMIARHYNTTMVYALFCFGHERRLALSGLADGLATLAISAVLVERIGLAGAPLGAIAGVALVALPLNLGALSREAGTSRRALAGALLPWLWRSAVLLAAASIAGVSLRPSSFTGLALLGGLAAVLYLGVVLGPLLQSPAGLYIRPLMGRARQAVTRARDTFMLPAYSRPQQ